MPTNTVRLAALLAAESSLPIALLFREVFERANRTLGTRRYSVQLVTSRALTRLPIRDVTVATRRAQVSYDYLVVPPYDGIDASWRPDPQDVRLIQRQHAHGGVVASACLGALTLAEAGVLDGLEATTHWSWTGEARGRYPRVSWNTRRIVCDQRAVITAGGYLAAVDLALHIVAATSSRSTAHTLGQVMLADSARQYQSIYALELTAPAADCGALRDLDSWIDRKLWSAPRAADMARHCNMSLRSFHRRFLATYGITPRKYLQLKRIEAVRKLLIGSRRTLQQILEEVGLSDVTSFRRVFQRELGHTPAEFRRHRGGTPSQLTESGGPAKYSHSKRWRPEQD